MLIGIIIMVYKNLVNSWKDKKKNRVIFEFFGILLISKCLFLKEKKWGKLNYIWER